MAVRTFFAIFAIESRDTPMKQTKLISILLLFLAVVSASAQSLSSSPAREKSGGEGDMARPWTFWYWMYGEVSKAGIHADLQAMKDVGLGGCYLMPIRGVEQAPEGLPSLGGEPAQQLTPRFWEMIDYAMQQADSLSLGLGLHVCDGFALAGGPWIRPEESMQMLVSTDTIVNGGHLVELTMAKPKYKENYYEDIAVYALPLSVQPLPTPAATYSDEVSINVNGVVCADSACWIQYDYGKSVIVRSVDVEPSGTNVQCQRFTVMASDDGVEFRTVRQLTPPRQGWQNSDFSTTFSLPPTQARYLRFCWTPDGTEPGSEDLDAAKWKPVLRVKRILPSSFPQIDNWQGKAGFVWRLASATPASDIDSEVVRAADIVSTHMQGDRLSIDLPEGQWRIVRIGHTSTGHTNATAGGGKGLECDKFQAETVRKQVNQWFGEFMKRPHSGVVKSMHVDSWECGSQNWSRNFAQEFERRRGYDLLPWLPAMVGIPIESAARSEEVLRDVRLTIDELKNEMFFNTVAACAREYGVSLSAECTAPTMMGDGMSHYRYTDLPMGEFWLNSPTHDKPNDMLDAISGAHVYGKPIVQAEGFTEVRGVWNETPATVKPLLDRNLALGMNRLFFHVFAHNPYMDKKPGMTLDGIGLFFQRDQTWFPEAKGLVDYVTRCQRLLQMGEPVTDIAVYTGDEMPRRAWRPEQLVDMLPGLIGADRVEAEQRRLANVGQPMEESPVGVRHAAGIVDPADWVNPLGGYAYDSMNPDALLHRPFNYRVLVVPQNVSVSAEARNRIDILSQQGVTIVDKPYAKKKFDGLTADVQVPEDVAFCHRRQGTRDIYFISNQQDSERRFEAVFRCHPRNVVFYDPMTDRHFIDVDDMIAADSLTILRMRMKPYQSLFVLFGFDDIRPQVSARWHVPVPGPDMPKPVFEWRLKGKWQLTFRESGKTLKSDSLFSWTSHRDPAVRTFSGHVRYKTTLHFKERNNMGKSILDLGRVCDVAHVWLNGRDLGILWMPPYEVDVSGYLRQGDNTLEIEVVNTWHNALRGADQGMPPYDGIWTNARYRTKGDNLLPAGLLGPVELKNEN